MIKYNLCEPQTGEAAPAIERKGEAGLVPAAGGVQLADEAVETDLAQGLVRGELNENVKAAGLEKEAGLAKWGERVLLEGEPAQGGLERQLTCQEGLMLKDGGRKLSFVHG